MVQATQTDPIDEFMALPQDKQLSMLKKLPRQNQDKLLEQVSQRRQHMSTQAAPAPKSLFQRAKDYRDKLTEIQKPDRSQPALKEAEKAIGNVGAGFLSVPLRPIDTAMGVARMSIDPFLLPTEKVFERLTGYHTPNVAEDLYHQFRENPLGTIESGIGQAAFAETASKVAPRVVPKRGPSRSVVDLVKDTKAANEAAAAKAQADYAKAVEAHKGEAAEAAHETQGRELAHRQKVQTKASEIRAERIKANREAAAKHQQDVTQTKAANEAAVRKQAKIPATREKLGTASQELQAQIETARNNALKIGNEKFNAVNEQLNDLPANTERVYEGLSDALGKIKGTETEPPILKGLANRIGEGEALTYRDLQGYYSELNAELSKGTLPGDIYTAYDTLHEVIGDDMQRIADSQGAGAQLKDARAYWRRMKQTFGKPYNPTDVANVVRERATGRQAVDEEQANRVRLLGSFDKGIPSTVEHISNLRQGLESLPKEQPVRNVVKSLPPKPTPLPTASASTEAARSVAPPERVLPSDRPQLNQPAPKLIGQAEVEAAKKAALENAANWTRNRGLWAAAWPAIYVLRDIFRGNVPSLAKAGMEAAGTLAVSRAVARALENPETVKFLTQATQADIDAIPPDLRGEFPAIIQAMQKQGVQISPALRSTFGGAFAIAPRKHPSD